MFKPLLELTSEWKEVPEGWKLPVGSEVKMNITTGKNEARLIKRSKEPKPEQVQTKQSEEAKGLNFGLSCLSAVKKRVKKDRDTDLNNVNEQKGSKKTMRKVKPESAEGQKQKISNQVSRNLKEGINEDTKRLKDMTETLRVEKKTKAKAEKQNTNETLSMNSMYKKEDNEMRKKMHEEKVKSILEEDDFNHHEMKVEENIEKAHSMDKTEGGEIEQEDCLRKKKKHKKKVKLIVQNDDFNNHEVKVEESIEKAQSMDKTEGSEIKQEEGLRKKKKHKMKVKLILQDDDFNNHEVKAKQSVENADSMDKIEDNEMRKKMHEEEVKSILEDDDFNHHEVKIEESIEKDLSMHNTEGSEIKQEESLRKKKKHKQKVKLILQDDDFNNYEVKAKESVENPDSMDNKKDKEERKEKRLRKKKKHKKAVDSILLDDDFNHHEVNVEESIEKTDSMDKTEESEIKQQEDLRKKKKHKKKVKSIIADDSVNNREVNGESGVEKADSTDTTEGNETRKVTHLKKKKLHKRKVNVTIGDAYLNKPTLTAESRVEDVDSIGKTKDIEEARQKKKDSTLAERAGQEEAESLKQEDLKKKRKHKRKHKLFHEVDDLSGRILEFNSDVENFNVMAEKDGSQSRRERKFDNIENIGQEENQSWNRGDFKDKKRKLSLENDSFNEHVLKAESDAETNESMDESEGDETKLKNERNIGVKKDKKEARSFKRKDFKPKTKHEKKTELNIEADEINEFETETSEIDTNRIAFKVEADQWREIKPKGTQYYGKNRRVVRRLQGPWTNIFAKGVAESHPGCVLSFRSHRVKQTPTRKLTGPFIFAKATCTGSFCCRVFTFTVEFEPMEEEDVTVNVVAEGVVMHDAKEVNRRDLSGKKRKEMGDILKSTSAASAYSENLTSADKSYLKLGNYGDVPNKAVLRKIVSEILQKEHLHRNVLAELEILKENYGENLYIQEIGMDPFTLILFSEQQINLVRTLSRNNNLNIYIDATGSVIQSIQGQKRPYLYSIVVKPDPELPPVSVADMITTQHTIPRIELFLGTFKRAVVSGGKKMKIEKVETDYSFALIQAALKMSNTTTLKSYVARCFEICTSYAQCFPYTCLHLCSAHMIKDFIRVMKDIKIEKKTKRFMISLFAALQNSSSLTQATEIYKNICSLFLAETESKQTRDALKTLQKRLKQIEEMEYIEDAIEAEDDLVKRSNEEDFDDMTIKEASPFTSEFEKIKNVAVAEIVKSKDKQPNIMYFPSFIDCLEKFLPIFPLWSGLMLRYLGNDGEYMTRDTNTSAEIWFKYLKFDLKMIRLRPAAFVIKIKKAVDGRLTEQEFPGSNKKKTTKKRKTTTDANLDTKEEIWKKKSTGKKSKYFHLPSKMTSPQKLPKVMAWGGEVEGVHLSNTCTIDNGLTIVHLFYKQHLCFRNVLEDEHSKVGCTLKTAMTLISKEEFAAAKAVWAGLTETKTEAFRVRNLFGDEYDFMFKHFDQEWQTIVESSCDSDNCQGPTIGRSHEQGCICIGYPTNIDCLQTLMDWWLKGVSPCVNYRIDETVETDNIIPIPCDGQRTFTRRIVNSFPVLPVRVYELCLSGKLSIETILGSKSVYLDNHYEIAGITMHKNDHYCAVVMFNETYYWYDGLSGKLRNIIRDIDEWFPSYVIYCQV